MKPYDSNICSIAWAAGFGLLLTRLDFSVRRSFTEGFGVSLVVSDPVRDVVAAVDKLRVDDRLITDPSMLLGDCEALLDSINGVQAVLVRRLREVTNDVRTVEITGR